MTKTIEELSGEVRKLRLLTGISAVVAVIALVLAGLALGQPAGGRGAPAAEVKTVAPQEPTVNQEAPEPSQEPIGKPGDVGPAHEGTIVLGAVGKGKPVLEIYEDYQCPACAQIHQFMGPEVDEVVASGTVEVRFHPMSFLDREQPQGNSWRAANGAFCANEQGKFLQYHNAIWPNQQTLAEYGWTDEALQGLVEHAGLDVKKWSSCLESGKFADTATKANTFALETVTATPTYVLNGTKLDLSYVQSSGGLMAVIDANR